MPKKLEKRNGHAFHPIMKKGGVHEKSEKAKRKAAKHQLHRKLKEWLGSPSLPCFWHQKTLLAISL